MPSAKRKSAASSTTQPQQQRQREEESTTNPVARPAPSTVPPAASTGSSPPPAPTVNGLYMVKVFDHIITSLRVNDLFQPLPSSTNRDEPLVSVPLCVRELNECYSKHAIKGHTQTTFKCLLLTGVVPHPEGSTSSGFTTLAGIY